MAFLGLPSIWEKIWFVTRIQTFICFFFNLVSPDYLLNILIIHPLTVVFVFTFCGVHTFPWLIVFQKERYTCYNHLDGYPLKHPMDVYKVKSETPIKFKRQVKKIARFGHKPNYLRTPDTKKYTPRFGFKGGWGVKTLWLPLSKSANKNTQQNWKTRGLLWREWKFC